MTLKKNAPGETHCLPPLPNLAAEHVVQVPDTKPTKEHAQSVADHIPHSFENLHIANILVVLVLPSGNGQALLFACKAILLARTPPFRTERLFHGVHTPQDHNGGQDRVRILVKNGVLQVMVVKGDKNGERGQRYRKSKTDDCWPRVGKGRIGHQTCGVNHGELIDKLHGI